MSIQLYEGLKRASKNNTLPYVIAYNRIDGPGSSLDLRQFQQALWSLPDLPKDIRESSEVEWSRNLPRTVGITIDIGTKIEAKPLEPDLIGVRSIEYKTEIIARPSEIPPIKENWLLKLIDIFGLTGVIFILHNLRPGIQSAGLGGSATAATGVCILANELANRPLSPIQLISMASRMEHDLGVSITGTQEQSNVVFGGITDYIWFPWGIPGRPETGYGESLRYELIPPTDYSELEQRMAIFHSGQTRASTDVNSVWMSKLFEPDGYQMHKLKPEIAYRFREALRLRNWNEAIKTTREYQEIRTKLCPQYINGSSEILGFSEDKGCTTFPLGAGGGGAVLTLAPDPEALKALKKDLLGVYREIPFQIKPKGHKIVNLPLERRE